MNWRSRESGTPAIIHELAKSPIHQFVIAAAAIGATAVVGAHANSVSSAEFSVESRAVRAVVRLPLDDIDLLLRIDRNLDGVVSDSELDAARPAVEAYVLKHLHLGVDGARIDSSLTRLTVWRDPARFQYLEAEVSYRPARTSGLLTIHTDFLTELYPGHKTLGRVTADGREDHVTFERTVSYERRIGRDRVVSLAAVGAALAILGVLWLARRRPRSRLRVSGTSRGAAVVALTLVATAAHADVIMSAPALNATLKTMGKLTQQATSAAPGQAEALFQLGAEADGLANIMNREVESHGMQERELLDLALARTRELGIGIVYNREKKQFFYDGSAFSQYLKAAPRGAHAAAAQFKLLSYQFYQSVSTSDVATLAAAADAKKRFLARYPAFEGNAEIRLYLAVDYRDLHRRYVDVHDAANAARYRELTRQACLGIERRYPRTEQADAARQLLRGLAGR